MDPTKKPASQQRSKLSSVNFIVFVTIGGDEFIATRIRGYKVIHFVAQITVKPAGHRAFFDSDILFTLKRIQDIRDCRYAGWDTVSSHNFSSVFNCQFCTIAMHIGSDIIATHEGSFRIRVLLANLLYSSMPSLHIFTLMA